MVRILLPLLILALLIGAWYYVDTHPLNHSPVSTSPSALGNRTKTVGCLAANALPDRACTPGAVDTSLTKDVLCSSRFSTKSVRNVPAQEKQTVYQEYSIATHRPGEYEVDHLVSLELGGSNDIANLWPEAAEPRPGYHEKDLFENYLHRQVCSGALSLATAQQNIASNWLSVYQSVPDIQTYR